MIKTWQQRCEEHPDHEGIVTEQMIRDRMQEEIDALRQALAQPEREYVNEVVAVSENGIRTVKQTTIPEREWAGLSDEEKHDVLEGATGDGGRVYYDTLFRSYEAKLKEKNGG